MLKLSSLVNFNWLQWLKTVERVLVSMAALAAIIPIYIYWEEVDERRLDRSVNLLSAKSACIELTVQRDRAALEAAQIIVTERYVINRAIRDESNKFGARLLGSAPFTYDPWMKIPDSTIKVSNDIKEVFEDHFKVSFEEELKRLQSEFAQELITLHNDQTRQVPRGYAAAWDKLLPFSGAVFQECDYIEELDSSSYRL